ncbi:MAG: mechanosensitive ion channel [Candidatus Latescibacteria bacterium]|nr:mechanosensitive ion channel [Candidatus Latescibacterota bacterium]
MDFFLKIFEISPVSLIHKAQKIAIVLLILLTCQGIMRVIMILNQWMVESKRGPFRYIFARGNKSITINLLTINFIKYFLYFTAFGYILSEIGIDYRAYMASLSIIGVAIGFGSQGLVQDVVTGLFLIFEGQYAVGDMVEISGQTGIVEGITLRTTALRNHLGELLTIPNRNIAVVGNFRNGGLLVCIDVAVTDREAAPAALEKLSFVSREIHRQFAGVVLSEPVTLGAVALETGEVFVRLQTTIWPGQTWVVDQQMVPRIREQFAAGGLTIPADRVVVFHR